MNFSYHEVKNISETTKMEFFRRLKPIENWSDVKEREKIVSTTSNDVTVYDVFLREEIDYRFSDEGIKAIVYEHSAGNFIHPIGNKNTWYYWDEDIVLEMFKDSVDKHNRTFLMNAINNEDDKTIEKLFNLGVNVFHKDNGNTTALHFAARKLNLPVCKKLVELGLDIHDTDDYEQNVLHCITQNNGDTFSLKMIECMDYFIELGVPIENGDDEEMTPLFLTRHVSIAEFLISKGANINTCDNVGTPYVAPIIGSNYVEVLELLFKHNVDINAKNKYGELPVSYINSYTSCEMIEKYIHLLSLESLILFNGKKLKLLVKS